MHKNGKWAKQIIEWQNTDGSWGDYHSLAVAGNSCITTEQAIRRLERLGYTIEDECMSDGTGTIFFPKADYDKAVEALDFVEGRANPTAASPEQKQDNPVKKYRSR